MSVGEAEVQGTAERHAAGKRVSYLEQALWKTLSEAASAEEFAKAWLGLQCQFLPGATGGVVILGETPETGPFAPAAVWPDKGVLDGALSQAVELCLAERRPVAEDGPRGAAEGAAVAAHPVMVGGKLCGAVGLRLDPANAPPAADAFRRLRWGVGWIEALLRREESAVRAALTQRTVTALELAAGALEQPRFKAACTAIATDLALRLDCDQVAVGFLGNRSSARVVAVSHSAQFGKRMNLVRRAANAMDEALDQEAAVLWPLGEDWEYRITHAHRELAESLGGGTILTVPLHRAGEMLGAITLQRPTTNPFDDDTIQLVDTVAGLVGPVLEEKRLNDRVIFSKIGESLRTQTRRLLGPRYFGRKLATVIAIAVVGFFAVATGEFRVSAPALLEGRIQRAVVAPFDGFVAAQYAKSGDVVDQGELLATLDDRELVLERLRHSANLRQRLAEYDRALAEDERVETRILRAQIAESEAQIALVDSQLARTQLKAPFPGLVIAGDLSQAIGSGVRRGDELFTLAPLDSYRVVIEVDERDIRAVEEGQSGSLVMSSLPDLQLPYTVERVTPVSSAEDGRNFFRVEADLEGSDPRLRPGMEGIAKTSVDERLLIEIWTRRLVDWVRLFAWKWLP
ncbi:MAG: HlyD family efflux transporter periplasmic adaptor subunit [Hyphomicrobiales bacterium]